MIVSITMNYNQIHEALKEKGLSWITAAEAIGCTHQHVMNVCSRRAESIRVAKSIAVLIDKNVAQVFPDVPRYQEDKKAARRARLEQARAQLEEAGLVAA